MKLYKFVSYTSLVIIALAMLILASVFIIPNSTIAWKPVIVFLSFDIALVFLLFTKPFLSSKIFLASTMFLAGIAVWGTVAGWIPPILLGIFLAACFALYISSGTPQLNFHSK